MDEFIKLKKEQDKLALEIIKLLKLDKIVSWLNLKIKRITKLKRIPHKRISLVLKNNKKLSGFYILNKEMEDKTGYILIYRLKNRFGKLINGNKITCVNKDNIAFYHIFNK